MQYRIFTSDGVLSGIRSMVGGFSVASGGAAATVNFRDGLTASDPIVLQIKLAANDSKTVDLTRTLAFDTAVYAEIATGTVQGTIWFE